MSENPFEVRAEGDAQRLSVEALGEPGQRRFRLLAVIEGTTHIVWLEKQQVFALGRAVEQILESLPDTGPALDDSVSVTEFDTATDSQFRAGRMELGFDEARDMLIVIAHDIETEEEEPRLMVRISRGQARDFSAEAAAVVAAGRPICPLCGRPMGTDPHVCAEQNGHLSRAIDEMGLGGDEPADGEDTP